MSSVLLGRSDCGPGKNGVQPSPFEETMHREKMGPAVTLLSFGPAAAFGSAPGSKQAARL